MGLFDIFKKKSPNKCSQCLRPIDGHAWSIDNKNYCQECYNRKKAIVQQSGGASAGVGTNCTSGTPEKNTFVCDICKRTLPVKYLHSRNVCADCANEKAKSAAATDVGKKAACATTTVEYLDDITFIRDMRHGEFGAWHQYDVLLEARGYGWDTIKDWADYMSGADLDNVSQVTVASLGASETDVTASYIEHGRKACATPELETEAGSLSISGISKALRAPVKIVWLNQTRLLRLFTVFKDEITMRKYVETVIRRTFGTPDAMKLGKPIPAEEEGFQMLIKDVFFVKGRGVVIDGTVQKGQISVNESVLTNGKIFKVRGIKTEKGLVEKVALGAKEAALLLDETASADFFKAGNIITAVPTKTAKSQEATELEKLQIKCKTLTANDKSSDELKKLKAEIWAELIRLDAIWVAIDTDSQGELPYIGLFGTMEIFTKEEYGLAAKEYFATHGEGNFKLQKVEKDSIVPWFERALFLGATRFNLDNGVRQLDFSVEDYIKYEAGNDISRMNRAIRSGLFRSVQAQNRYSKINTKDTEFVKTLISVLYSNGYTALANGTVFALTFGPYAENVTFVSKKVFEKYSEIFAGDSVPQKYKIEIDEDSKIPVILKDEILKIVTKESIVIVQETKGLQTIRFPNNARFVPVFTDKAEAEKMREKFATFGKDNECNVIAVDFDEIISPILTCDGAIVDHTIYSHVIHKEMLLQIKAQMDKSVSGVEKPKSDEGKADA